jgi:hypothetical protein
MLTPIFLKRQFRLTLWLVALLMLWGSTTKAHALENPSTQAILNWRNLGSPSYIWPADGAVFYTFQTANGSKANLMVANMKSGRWSVKPAINDTTLPTSETAQKSNANGAINGGYFNLSDGVSASYVVIDGKEVANPRTNEALIKNTRLQPFLETIFNRSEIRILQDKLGKAVIQIVPHNAVVAADLKLVHSLQAGPQLVPLLTAKDEAFIRQEADGKEADSIGCNKPAARTAFGVTDDGYAILACIAGNGQDPESHGITLKELADLMAHLGCSHAINLDGGASSSMFVRLNSDAAAGAAPQGKAICGKTPETRVKSVLLLQHAAQ